MKRRNSMRYAGYDYRAPGAYAVTISAYKGRLIFGEIAGSEMQLSPLGEIAGRCVENLAGNHAGIHVEATVVMPNHVHVLLIFKQDPPPAKPGPAVRRFGRPVAGSLSTLIGAYKAEVTRQARSAGWDKNTRIWHRNLWDHIVRNDADFENQRYYIATNPARWLEDQLHPDAPPNRFKQEWDEDD
jgi:REP element-mobilizing transposase RayT